MTVEARYVVTCCACTISQTPPAPTRRQALTAAADLGWRHDDAWNDVCPHCRPTTPRRR